MTTGNMEMNDKDVAMDMLTTSKSRITSISKVLTETTNSQLREVLKNQLTSCVSSHFRLSDMAISKGWYNAYDDPEQQLKKDLNGARSLV
jgi:similar to spore coat protein